MWATEKPHLNPLPPHPFDIATVSQIRASRQFRITLDTNRYSVPAHFVGQALTLKTYPDRLCIYTTTSSSPAIHESTTATVTLKTPIIPKPCSNSAKRPAISSSFAVF